MRMKGSNQMNMLGDYINMEQILQTCTVTNCNMHTDPSTGEIKKIVVEFSPKSDKGTEGLDFGKLETTNTVGNLFRKNGGK